MYYLTGKQFAGTCSLTLRPPCLSGSCFCGCSPNQVNLGIWPVTQLNSVRYGGVVYTGASLTNTFHINDYRFLARNDGERFLSGNQWAVAGSAQDLAADPHVFEVNLSHGIKIPKLLTRGTRDLACQFLTACCGGECDLPDNITSVSRSGVTFSVGTAVEALQNRHTGIYSVDLAISTFNPETGGIRGRGGIRLQSPSFIWNPNRWHGRNIH